MPQAQAPVRKGRKDPSLLAQTHPKPVEGSGHVYLVAGRPLPYRGHTLPAGTEVPGAASWPRLDAWISARRLRLADPNEEYVSHADFVAAIEKAIEDSTPTPPPAPEPPPAPNPGPPPTASVEETKPPEE